MNLYIDTLGASVNSEAPDLAYIHSSPTDGRMSVEDGFVSAEPNSEAYGTVHYYNRNENQWKSSIYPSTPILFPSI